MFTDSRTSQNSTLTHIEHDWLCHCRVAAVIFFIIQFLVAMLRLAWKYADCWALGHDGGPLWTEICLKITNCSYKGPLWGLFICQSWRHEQFYRVSSCLRTLWRLSLTICMFLRDSHIHVKGLNQDARSLLVVFVMGGSFSKMFYLCICMHEVVETDKEWCFTEEVKLHRFSINGWCLVSATWNSQWDLKLTLCQLALSCLITFLIGEQTLT